MISKMLSHADTQSYQGMLFSYSYQLIVHFSLKNVFCSDKGGMLPLKFVMEGTLAFLKHRTSHYSVPKEQVCSDLE